jgi:hypothetical protein
MIRRPTLFIKDLERLRIRRVESRLRCRPIEAKEFLEGFQPSLKWF